MEPNKRQYIVESFTGGSWDEEDSFWTLDGAVQFIDNVSGTNRYRKYRVIQVFLEMKAGQL